MTIRCASDAGLKVAPKIHRELIQTVALEFGLVHVLKKDLALERNHILQVKALHWNSKTQCPFFLLNNSGIRLIKAVNKGLGVIRTIVELVLNP